MKLKQLSISIATYAVCLIFSHCSNEIEFAKPYVKPVDKKFFQDGEVELVFENDRVNGINVIFLGDGYIKENLGKEYGNYKKDGLSCINALFDSPPFSEYKNHFNAYIVYAESQETGVKVDQTTKLAKFGGTWISGGIGDLSHLTITKHNTVYEYVAKLASSLSGKNLVLMAVNGVSGGSAVLNGDLAVFGNLSNPEATAIHEIGHAFAGLYDEYVFDNPKSVEYDVTNAPNLDIINDLGKIKWHHFIDLKDRIYSQLGAFEGGGYNHFGVWRPNENSIMRSIMVSGNFFNAPSREAIVKRIMSLRGIPFDFKAFLVVDKISALRINSFAGRIDNTNQMSHPSVSQYRCFPF